MDRSLLDSAPDRVSLTDELCRESDVTPECSRFPAC